MRDALIMVLEEYKDDFGLEYIVYPKPREHAEPEKLHEPEHRKEHESESGKQPEPEPKQEAHSTRYAFPRSHSPTKMSSGGEGSQRSRKEDVGHPDGAPISMFERLGLKHKPPSPIEEPPPTGYLSRKDMRAKFGKH